MSDFVVFSDIHQRDWRGALVDRELLEHIHERCVFSHGSLRSTHSVVSSIHLALFNKRPFVDNCFTLALSTKDLLLKRAKRLELTTL